MASLSLVSIHFTSPHCTTFPDAAFSASHKASRPRRSQEKRKRSSPTHAMQAAADTVPGPVSSRVREDTVKGLSSQFDVCPRASREWISGRHSRAGHDFALRRRSDALLSSDPSQQELWSVYHPVSSPYRHEALSNQQSKTRPRKYAPNILVHAKTTKNNIASCRVRCLACMVLARPMFSLHVWTARGV